MRLILITRIYKCEACGRNFDILALPEGTYGEFILYSQDGEMAYWNALTDPVFDEVGDVTKNLPALEFKSEINKSSAYLAICGICCDRAKDGSVFQLRPICPHCNSDRTTFIREPEPMESATVEVPHVTHEHWSQLSTKEREQVLLSELARKKLL